MLTVKSVKERCKGEFARCEFFKVLGEGLVWSCEELCYCERAPEEAVVAGFMLMGEKEYNEVFFEPYGEFLDFLKEFGRRDVKILCVAVPKGRDFLFKRRIKVGERTYSMHVTARSYEEASRKLREGVRLGTWHQFLELEYGPNLELYHEREDFFARMGFYPEAG